MKIKLLIVLILLVQLMLAQESEWHWQNPYPLPFIHEIHQGVDDWLIVQHASGDMYQINDDGTFTELDMNLSPFNFVNGPGNFKLISKQKWILFVPYAIYITEDGGKSYDKYTSDIYWQYGDSQFIDELHGIAKRIHGDTKQVVKTVDGGKTWSVIYTGKLPRDIEMITETTIYYLTSGSDIQIMKTNDGGGTWELRGKCDQCDYIQKVGDNLLLERGPYVYISEDDGLNLKQVLLTYDENVSLQIESKSKVSGSLIIKSNGKRLFKSLDGGYTWNIFDTGYPDLHLNRGFFKNDKNYYSIYRSQHKGIMKLYVPSMGLSPILSEPLTNLGSMKEFDSGIIGVPSYDWANARIMIFTSENEGYTWSRHFLNLPNGNKYIANAMQLKSDSSMYILLNDSLYYYKSFTGNYTSKIKLDSVNYQINRYYSIEFDEFGKGIVTSSTFDYIYSVDDSSQSIMKIPITDYKFYRSWRRSDGKYWLFGSKIENYKEKAICLLDNNKMDTCYALGNYALFNLLDDDMIVGDKEPFPSGKRYNEKEENAFCPALPGYILSVISEDKMVMKNQGLLYVANPQTCEIIENVNLDYLAYIEDENKWNDFRFIELQNEDILGYSYGGYLIRKTDNFLDTLLYNSNKEVEYKTPTQEYQFLVYPNPTSDWLQVKDMPYGVECRIIDMTGREYMHGKQSLIYTGQYPSGTYIIQFIQDGRLIESQKIVIQ